ncbi:MAG: sensor histidine kinase [Roseburia sp.]|uniref:ATP-binding protein n=1 Tax=Roseburia hominis TaxID=301301 RepID=UPI001F2B25C2|nr:two-component sensor histidine kinase [Roseburia hominis]
MTKRRIITFLKSLRFRLIIIFMILGILPGMLLRAGMLKSYEKKAVSNKSIDILSQSKILANKMVASDYLNDISSEVITAQLEQLSMIYDGRVILIDHMFHIVKDTYGLDQNKTIISEEVMKSFRGKEVSNYDSENRYIEMTIPLTNTDTNEVIGVMLVSVSMDSIVANSDYLKQNLLIMEVISSIAIFAISLFLAIHLTKPFGRMSKSIEEIQTGYGDSNLMIDDYSEFQDISTKLNELTGRMKILDDSRQEFVSNVSHELKTPLTSMKVLADSLNGQEDVPIELYKEFMADIGGEIERETKIINDLLSLVKMDKSAGELNISSVNMNELLEQILKRLRPIADKQHVDLVLESFRPVTAEVDEVKITLAITNLIENGIKYNKPEGWVHVSLNADHQFCYLKVSDSGIGIPEDSLEHIYERFYRVDKSHSREIGGTGLGLAITRNAVLMHRGAIKVFSTVGEGTIFNVRIPLNYIA